MKLTELPDVAYYVLFYGLLLIVAIVGMTIKSLPNDVGIAMISFVMGHGSGLFSPPPTTPTPTTPPTKNVPTLIDVPEEQK